MGRPLVQRQYLPVAPSSGGKQILLNHWNSLGSRRLSGVFHVGYQRLGVMTRSASGTPLSTNRLRRLVKMPQ